MERGSAFDSGSVASWGWGYVGREYLDLAFVESLVLLVEEIETLEVDHRVEEMAGHLAIVVEDHSVRKVEKPHHVHLEAVFLVLQSEVLLANQTEVEAFLSLVRKENEIHVSCIPGKPGNGGGKPGATPACCSIGFA